MKYTFTYESNKHENKTITVSFNAISGEKTILDNFLSFLKAVGYVYDKNEILKIVNETDEYKKMYDKINQIDFRFPPPDYKPSNQIDLSGLNLSGFPGISEDTFIKPNFNFNVSNVSSHGHGTRAPFVGPADC